MARKCTSVDQAKTAAPKIWAFSSSGGLVTAALVFAMMLPIAHGVARVQEGGVLDRSIHVETNAPKSLRYMEQNVNTWERPAYGERLEALSEHAFAVIPRTNPLPRAKHHAQRDLHSDR